MGGYHRIQLLLAIGTFSDHRQCHFQMTSTIAGDVFFFHSFCHVCLLVSPADCEVGATRRHLVRRSGRASLWERGGSVVHECSVIVFWCCLESC